MRNALHQLLNRFNYKLNFKQLPVSKFSSKHQQCWNLGHFRLKIRVSRIVMTKGSLWDCWGKKKIQFHGRCWVPNYFVIWGSMPLFWITQITYKGKQSKWMHSGNQILPPGINALGAPQITRDLQLHAVLQRLLPPLEKFLLLVVKETERWHTVRKSVIPVCTALASKLQWKECRLLNGICGGKQWGTAVQILLW